MRQLQMPRKGNLCNWGANVPQRNKSRNDCQQNNQQSGLFKMQTDQIKKD
jgi:hypothetical protein